ncbi:MAG: ATP-binding protein, partial [Bacteroidales bacterium]
PQYEKQNFQAFYKELISEGRIDKRLVKLKKCNGRVLDVVFNAHAENDQLGNIVKIHCIFSDVTQIKKAESAMRIAKEKAEENDMLKSTFLANMSHEIRSPMNAILGFSELLKKPDLPHSRKKRFLNLIHERGEDLLRIIDDIIDFSKLEAGSLRLHYEMVNLNGFLDDLQLSLNEERKRQKKENIAFYLEKAPGVQNINWKTDKIRTRQILVNFLSNALKFTDQGYIKLTVKRQNDQIIFSVKDTGTGIPKERQKSVFERFRQLDLQYKSSRSGTGLGLSISKNLAEKMEGDIQLKSEPGKGSIFSLILPLKELKESAHNAFRKTEEAKPEIPEYPHKNVLIVEDEFDNYLYLKNILETTRANLFWAKTANETVKFVESDFKPDLILMDIRLPDTNGLKMSRWIKNKFPEIPVIAQTAFAQPEDKQQSLESGCDDYLSKPVSGELLLAMVEKYLNK